MSIHKGESGKQQASQMGKLHPDSADITESEKDEGGRGRRERYFISNREKKFKGHEWEGEITSMTKHL